MVLCIVTIHGIGFQQPPEKDDDGKEVYGYADDLHKYLCTELNQNGKVLLSDDPDRQRFQTRESVPIYIRSDIWPDLDGVGDQAGVHRERSLDRLGTWKKDPSGALSISYEGTHKLNQSLVKENASIAHVALVYSELEGAGPQILASVEAISRAIIYANRYTHFKGLLKLAFRDTQPLLLSAWARLKSIGKQTPEPSSTPSLCVRQDTGYRYRLHHVGILSRHPRGFLAILRQLENDVAAYVFSNELRQRVRSFVLDALLRLASRKDVSGIILNTHSNGTLIALDVLQELPPDAATKIRAIITAGSPIRKYIDFFEWGKYLAVRSTVDQKWMKEWINVYDKDDPVADPLRPYAGWKQGDDRVTEKELGGVYQAFDPVSGKVSPIPIVDRPVNNTINSPDIGLRAHNYWDNEKEFIPLIVKIVRNIHNGDYPTKDLKRLTTVEQLVNFYNEMPAKNGKLKRSRRKKF